MLYSAFYISKFRYEAILKNTKKKCATNKIRYPFDLYQLEDTLVFAHQVDLEKNTYYNFKKIAEDMRLDLGVDDDGLYIIHKYSARGRIKCRFTILS